MIDKKVFEYETYVIWERVEKLQYLNGDFVLSHPRAKVLEAIIDKEKDLIQIRYHWFQDKLNNLRNDLILKEWKYEYMDV